MNFSHIVTDNLGLAHLIFSIISLAAGTLVLALKKGTGIHRRIGYVYTVAMIIVLISAFSMYNLFGTWGIFHWSALVSSITLACGLIPIVIKRPKANYITTHFSFMYWSVIGLYGAFMAEIFVRFPKIVVEVGIPNSMFYNMTGLAVGTTMGIGAYCFFKLMPNWDKQFSRK